MMDPLEDLEVVAKGGALPKADQIALVNTVRDLRVRVEALEQQAQQKDCPHHWELHGPEKPGGHGRIHCNICGDERLVI